MSKGHTCCGCGPNSMTRREFFEGMGAAAVGPMLLSPFAARAAAQDISGYAPVRVPLRIQPVLTYEIPVRRQGTSWRNWGGVQTETAVAQESARIQAELKGLAERADFPLEVLPLKRCKSVEEATGITRGDHDGIIIYASGAWVDVIEELADPAKWNLIFIRHRSGPVYLWYEIIHNRFLRKTVDEFGQPGLDIDDVVVDDQGELTWRLRALDGLKNTLGKRVLAVGGASGWGTGGEQAPRHAKDFWKIDAVPVSYDELGRLLAGAFADRTVTARAEKDASAYLGRPGVKLETDRSFVVRCFVLTEVLKKMMAAAGTDAMTINNCMGTIMEVSKTTACLPLSLMNDAGFMAFCESDFVVIPAGVLLHYIAGRPFFMNDPTYPHDGVVTLAHCTAARRLDGKNLEKVRILTHFESDYGAAPKVEMRAGQIVTNIIPDFSGKKWAGFQGVIKSAPFMPICRSQIEVGYNADTEALLKEMKGFHWMTCYGDFLKETGYALKKAGIGWLDLSAGHRKEPDRA